ncbi:prolyl oligopeptidase family serine peptidase [Luteococcus sp. H138]|uniref:prolyl oligopeptidase family serine peptidase n=1 Tax=unclassified Luteococcus TaxID=2639923 RepID=UPI00313ED11E
MTNHPVTATDDLVEDLHGHRIADPYRWLEDVDSERTRAWVAEQRAFAAQQLSALPHRAFFDDVMAKVTSRPRWSTPWCSKGLYFQERHDGVRNQPVLHVADSLEELQAGGRPLVDPNLWSADGSSSLAFITVNPQASLIAVGRSDAGSDWTRISIIAPDGTAVDDVETITKFSQALWLPDGQSYVYKAFPGAGRAEGTETRALPGCRLMVHRIGDDPSQDVTFADFELDPQVLPWPELSDDDRWLVAHLATGTERSNRIWLYPVREQAGRSVVDAEPVELIDKARAAWHYLGTHDGELLFHTDDDAPQGRVVALRQDEWTLREVVAEGAAVIDVAALAAENLLVQTLEDAQTVLRRWSLGDAENPGAMLGRVELPDGVLDQIHARATSDEVFLGLSTLTEAVDSWRLDAATGVVTQLPGPQTDWQAPRYRTERCRTTSADGTQVPYFLIVPEAVDLAEARPTMLYGYGGFDSPVLANHRATWPGWLAAGGVLVIANLRGGGEFGRDWYEDGIKANKQHVFDDVIAVAEQLVADGVTTPAQLAIHGKSNGGLLVGAAITQRPDLFAVALPHVGVLDALRFHKFTIGKAWVSDYGNPDEKQDFERILGWSPLHNITPGTRYPATLVLTSDHDDRVVPAHSYKFTAALQAAQVGEEPVVARIEPATGHGLASKPPTVLAAECADLLAFAAQHTGLVPSAGPGSEQ